MLAEVALFSTLEFTLAAFPDLLALGDPPARGGTPFTLLRRALACASEGSTTALAVPILLLDALELFLKAFLTAFPLPAVPVLCLSTSFFTFLSCELPLYRELYEKESSFEKLLIRDSSSCAPLNIDHP